ncbi:MAG: heparinase, partial [Opitutaceae bacterium]|nr:heparinase [Opitutaceae bacterium]
MTLAQILRYAVCFLGGCLVAFGEGGFAPPLGQPDLLLNATRVAEIRQTAMTDPLMMRLLRGLRLRADAYLTNAPLRYEANDLHLMTQARLMVAQTLTWGVMQRLTGDERYAAAARAALLQAAVFPRWFVKDYLRAGEMSFAVALGYNWFGDGMTGEQKRLVRAALVRNTLIHATDAYAQPPGAESKFPWRAFGDQDTAFNNHSQICNAGFLATALVMQDAEPALAQTVFSNAPTSLRRPMAWFAPDGVWPEGPTYWRYGLVYNVLAIALLGQMPDSGDELAAMPGFGRTLDYGRHIFGPTGMSFNYSDGGPARDHAIGAGGELAWLAHRFGREDMLPLLRDRLANHLNQTFTPGETSAINDRFLALSALWFPGHATPPPPAEPLDAHFKGAAEVVSLRSAWGDAQALWIAMKTGRNGLPHSNLDLGGFVFESSGVRWGIELGSDNYALPKYWQDEEGGTRWTYFRCNNHGQNTPEIDGTLQAARGEAAIVAFASRPDRAFAVADLTNAYPGRAARVLRGVAMIDRRRVLIQDEIHGGHP